MKKSLEGIKIAQFAIDCKLHEHYNKLTAKQEIDFLFALTNETDDHKSFDLAMEQDLIPDLPTILINGEATYVLSANSTEIECVFFDEGGNYTDRTHIENLESADKLIVVEAMFDLLVAKYLREEEIKCKKESGLNNTSGGFASITVDEYHEFYLMATLKYGIQSDVEDSVQTFPMRIEYIQIY